MLDSQPLRERRRRYETVDSTQVEELDERMKKLTHKLENARRDMVRGAASEAYAVYETSHALLPRLGRHVRSHDG